MVTNYEDIVNVSNIGKFGAVDMNQVFKFAEQENLQPSNQDAERILLLCIDVQKDFIEGGALGVNGSVADVERITRFIYNNISKITGIMCSLDTHTPHQIFHPCWWVDKNGEHPQPFTVITYDDVKNGKWFPVIAKPQISLDYLKELEKCSKQLCIWPYHCIAMTEGGTLENEFAKMVYFHSVARNKHNTMVSKGQDPYSEMYGIIKPEYSRKNYINAPVLSAIEKYDKIFVVGEAADFCFKESVKQIAEHFKDRPDVTSKITILKDCTSSINSTEMEITAVFEDFHRQYGISFAKSTDIQL